jgi:glutamate synthase (NADPH/NADH) large chain
LSFDVSRLKITIQNHVKFTKSEKGKLILSNWEKYLPLFVKITPFEFKRALNDRKEKVMINKIAGE